MSNYQERIFVQLLDDDENTAIDIKKILKSPLGLSNDIIKKLFKNQLHELKNDLDKVKLFAAGISRAEKLNNYKLAQYYPSMFSFHQFFQSSYRARQGKVLEVMLKNILIKYANCNEVPDKTIRMQAILSQSFNGHKLNSDIDVMGLNSDSNKIILLQLRSRDDTGGTTAKGSLVELLRNLLQLKILPSQKLLYLICIWDERNSQQKNATITKLYSALSNFIPNKDVFKMEISNGYTINEKITLKLAYGTDEISNAIFKWTETEDNNIALGIKKIIKYIENWDDLWIAYSVANIELETFILKEVSNIDILNKKLNQINVEIDFNNYNSICSSVENILNAILPIWTEDTIPFSSPGDKAHYIRDLIFLKAIYLKLN